MSPRRDFINPWKQRGLWNLIKYHFWHRITRNFGRAEQESIGTFFACLCEYLLLVTAGDKILTQLDPWSEYVCLVGVFYLHFFCEKKSCFYLLRLEKRSRLMKIHCGIPLLFIQFDDNVKSLAFLSVCDHSSWALLCPPGPDFRSTTEGSSLPAALYLDISIDSYLQTDFLPFLAWIMETADFSVACGIGVVPEVHNSLFWNQGVRRRETQTIIYRVVKTYPYTSLETAHQSKQKHAVGVSPLEISVANSCWRGRASPKSICLGASAAPDYGRTTQSWRTICQARSALLKSCSRKNHHIEKINQTSTKTKTFWVRILCQ